jgi:hypothetical protein
MDWKQFLASVIGSLAWPIAAVAIVYFFRNQIRVLIGHIEEIGAAGVKLKMAEKVEEAIDAGEVVQAEKGLAAPDVVRLDPSFLQLVRSFPEAALIQSFKELEALILKIRERMPDDRPFRNLYEVLKALEKLQFIPLSAVVLFQSLREARNAAAHGKGEAEISSSEALDLIQQIKLLQEVLRPVLDQLPKKSTRI